MITVARYRETPSVSVTKVDVSSADKASAGAISRTFSPSASLRKTLSTMAFDARYILRG